MSVSAAASARPAIRALRHEDHADWLRLWKGYQAFYRVDISEATSAVTFERLLDPAEPMFCALAVDEQGSPVGLVHWIFHRSNWTLGDYCYLQDLFVDEGLRGHGHGRQLIEHVYADAQRQAAERVYWLTHESNAEAIQLYERIAERSGFIHYRHTVPQR